MSPIDIQLKRLAKIIQRLKSLILQDLDLTTREEIKAQLAALESNYLSQSIDFDQYKFQAFALLLSYRPLHWVEQFLYRETGNFLTQAEKFTLCDLSQSGEVVNSLSSQKLPQ